MLYQVSPRQVCSSPEWCGLSVKTPVTADAGGCCWVHTSSKNCFIDLRQKQTIYYPDQAIKSGLVTHGQFVEVEILQQLQYASTGVHRDSKIHNTKLKQEKVPKCNWHLHGKATLALENVSAVLFWQTIKKIKSNTALAGKSKQNLMCFLP